MRIAGELEFRARRGRTRGRERRRLAHRVPVDLRKMRPSDEHGARGDGFRFPCVGNPERQECEPAGECEREGLSWLAPADRMSDDQSETGDD